MEAPPPPQAPLPAAIRRLEDGVVHRIAAGEVVQRPASALKEMLENSLDAGARHVSVVVKEGGLKYLQIQDDGCGVRLEDLPILCHRHTTSKLRAFEDLETISTLGFRGEALASITYVAHVTVTTMTAAMQQHGYRVKYADGEMLPPGPKPVAAVPGTVIIVEDMFYNMMARRRAFKPGPEEHNLLMDVLQRYAIHKAGSVGFTLKRQGEARSDLHTLPTASRLDVIRSLFGTDLAASLLPLAVTGGSGDVSADVPLDAPMAFTASGFVSNLAHAGRRSVLVLFINGRPVEQGQLRRAIEGVYTSHNPKAAKPWVYLDLALPPRHVEVNQHPTKREVGFLHQQQIIDELCRAVEHVLVAAMDTRTFAINRPVALAAAASASAAAGLAAAAAALGAAASADAMDADAGIAAADGDGSNEAAAADGGTQAQQQQGSGPLKPLNGQPRGSASSQAATAAGNGSQHGSQAGSKSATGAGSQAPAAAPTYYRPQKLVRTDHRTQSIEGFLVSRASAAAVATAATGSVKRRRSAASPGAGAGSGLFGATGATEGDDGAAGVFSNASMHLQAAAAEAAAAAAELQAGGGDQATQEQQQQVLLRPVSQPRLPPVATLLSSVRELLTEVSAAVHGELQQLFKEHTWVGMADDQLALLQHGTRLYLVAMGPITRDLFYQLLLAHWEAVPLLALAQPLHVGQLMGLALEHEEAAGRWQPEPGATRQELCELVQALLAQKAEMLREYAGLALEQDQQQQQPGLYLTALPLLLQGYVPDLSGLPHLILQLARDVDWDSEKECFRTLAAAVAQFYALKPLLPAAAAEQQQQQQPAQPDGTQPASAAAAPPAGGGTGNGEPQAEPQPMNVDLSNGAAAETRSSDVAAAATATAVQQTPPPPQPDGGLLLQAGHRSQAQREWLLRHVVMPAVKYVYRPSRERARDGSVLLLTSMERLYRVFERCGW